MASETDSSGGKAAFLDALNVRQNAVRGFVAGILFTVAIFVFFVVVPGATRSPLYYLALAFVLATGLGGILTGVLTAVSAYRLSKRV